MEGNTVILVGGNPASPFPPLGASTGGLAGGPDVSLLPAAWIVLVSLTFLVIARWLLSKPALARSKRIALVAPRVLLHAALLLDALFGAWLLMVAFSPGWLLAEMAAGPDYDAGPIDIGIFALAIAVFLIGLSQVGLFDLDDDLRRKWLHFVAGIGAAVSIVFLGGYAAIVGNDAMSLNASAGNLIIAAIGLLNLFACELYVMVDD
jgi:hypothetical protein